MANAATDTTITALPSLAEQLRFEAFATHLAATGRSARTIKSYRCDWSCFVRWAAERGDAFELPALTAADLRAWRGDQRHAGAQASTINRKLVFVKRYADWAVVAGVLPAATAKKLRAVRPVPQPKRQPKPLSDFDRQRLVRELDRRGTARDRAIVFTLLQSGVRVGELVTLERADLHLAARSGHLAVRAANGSARRAAIGPRAAVALHRYLETRGDAPGPLFVGERGPLTANGVQRLLRKYCTWAGVEATPSTLRHTFAQRFLVGGKGDAVALADALGHETLDAVRLYAPRTAVDLRDVRDA